MLNYSKGDGFLMASLHAAPKLLKTQSSSGGIKLTAQHGGACALHYACRAGAPPEVHTLTTTVYEFVVAKPSCCRGGSN